MCWADKITSHRMPIVSLHLHSACCRCHSSRTVLLAVMGLTLRWSILWFPRLLKRCTCLIRISLLVQFPSLQCCVAGHCLPLPVPFLVCSIVSCSICVHSLVRAALAAAPLAQT